MVVAALDTRPRPSRRSLQQQQHIQTLTSANRGFGHQDAAQQAQPAVAVAGIHICRDVSTHRYGSINDKQCGHENGAQEPATWADAGCWRALNMTKTTAI